MPFSVTSWPPRRTTTSIGVPSADMTVAVILARGRGETAAGALVDYVALTQRPGEALWVAAQHDQLGDRQVIGQHDPGGHLEKLMVSGRLA